MKLSKTWRLLALVPLLAALGCGADLVRVKGRLTYKGQPVPSTYVKFWPQEEGKRYSTGLTDDNGNFTLHFSRTEPGVYRGQHTVALTYYVSVEEELHQIPPKASKELKEVIGKYGDPGTSKLHAEVTGDGQFIELNID